MQLQTVHPIIGDVRGKGLMLGVELVIPGTKNPLNIEKVTDLHDAIKNLGVLIGRGGRWSNVLRIKPPMCITKEDVDLSISVLDDVFKNAF